MSSIRRSLSVVFLCALGVSGCTSAGPPADANPQLTQAVATALASILGTQAASAPTPTTIPIATPTVAQTPPALPAPYVSSYLNPLDTPHSYVQDQCEYIRNKWTPANSPPGTIVMVIMFHSIEKGEATVTDSKSISSSDFKQLMNSLHDMGFQAINTEQLADFLEHNAKIPQRSVLLTQDDRHAAANFNDWFRPYWEMWQWPVVNGWISAFGGTDPVLAENVALEQEGWVDHQAHGVVHNIPMGDGSSDEYLTGELQGSITNMQEYFKKTPIAIIWPGGGFGVRPVQFARKFGYRLGFTTNPRGPVMFDWVPLADQPDPGRPYFIPEGPVGDPLMVLPRYWDVDARAHLDDVRRIGEEAGALAQQNKATEMAYYDIVCAGTYGAIE